jgi:uncharacterized protein (TIGR02284 family)
MTKPVTILNDLYALYCDGAEFYIKSAKKAHNSDLIDLFVQMSAERRNAAEELEPYINGRGATPKDGTVIGELRQSYTDFLNMFENAKKSEETMIGQLEEHEDRTLAQIDTAMSEDLPVNVKRVIAGQQARFNQTHNSMRALKKAVNA